MIRVTRRYRFSASHRLHSSQFTELENRELYGKCNNPYGHGHDYVLEVGVEGPLDAATGQVVKIETLDRLVAQSVLKDFEYRNLNADIPEFGARVATSENITAVIEARLQAEWRSAFPGQWPRLEKIGLQETKRNRFELKA